MTEKHVLITGGCGFIGSNLAARLLSEGHTITILDNLSRPGSEINCDWLTSLSQADRLHIMRGDVRQLKCTPEIGQVFGDS